jgi:uncharacterized membrane protein
MSDLFWFLKPPYTLFDLGVFLLFLGAVYTYIGKAYVRFSGWVYRADEPKRYWLEVATYYLGGVVCIGLFFIEVYVSSS